MDKEIYMLTKLQMDGFEEEGSWIDGMAAGAFTTMWGNEIEIKPEDLSSYVVNTQANLQATEDKDGNLVGLPIDDWGHSMGLAAGWITDVRLATDGRNVIEFKVRWNDTGKELISSDQMRYFSPTFNMKAKAIVGGSLTNWPATRTENEKILLKPVALSQDMYRFEENQTFGGLIKAGFEDLKDALGISKRDSENQDTTERKNMDEILETPEAQAEIERLADARAEERAKVLADKRVAEALALQKRQAHVAEVVARVIGGTDEKPVGLAVNKENLEKFMLSLPEDGQEQFEEMLSEIADAKIVSFEEDGHGKQLDGKMPLPDNMAQQLSKWVEAKSGTVSEWFTMNADMLGEMESYDLSKYKEDK